MRTRPRVIDFGWDAFRRRTGSESHCALIENCLLAAASLVTRKIRCAICRGAGIDWVSFSLLPDGLPRFLGQGLEPSSAEDVASSPNVFLNNFI